MRNIILRVIVWIVGVPLLVAIIWFLPFQNHLVFNVLVVIASALGTRELASLFERKDAGYRASSLIIPVLGMVFPLCELLILNGVVPEHTREVLIYAIPAVILLLQLLRRDTEGFRHTLTNSAANIALLIYPGLLLSYLIRLSGLRSASAVVLTFLCLVFFNDTMAYVSGMAYRVLRDLSARRRGTEWKPRFVFPVSPTKTVVGFAGGLLIAPVTLVAASLIFPDTFAGSTVALLLVGLAVGAATIMGDLIESALKRSATSKDSGSLIPGRGGVLDSIDSVLYAAPVFYYLVGYVL